MKRSKTAAAAAVITALLMCGCTEIPRRSDNALMAETGESGETSEQVYYDEIPPTEYEIKRKNVRIKLNAEGGVFDGSVRTDGDYDGHGYIVLDEGMTLTHIADVASSQHYRVVIAAHSYDGAAVRLSAAGESAGTYYIPASDFMGYSLYAIDCLYLSSGPSLLNFEVISGSVSMDYILVENSSEVSVSAYRTRSSSVSSNSSVSAIGAMKFLVNSYGKRVITGQNVTIGTNAELETIYAETGRWPAMRCGDLAYSSSFAPQDKAEDAVSELNNAIEWGQRGGLVSFTWHWYSPAGGNADVYSGGTDYTLSSAVTEQEIALLGQEEIDSLCESGVISESCRALIKDIDMISAALIPFKQASIPVIWQPLPDGEGNLYWWGGDAQNYKWLWQLMFDRMNGYHGLNNLIWVWNGSSPDYYPGDDLCDIIGQSLYENSSAPFAGRFASLARMSDTDVKPLAITNCDKVPNPSHMRRDNAMWLWFAAGNGEYIINSDGTLSEQYTSWQALHDAYNSEICVTLDELPDFTEYAFE